MKKLFFIAICVFLLSSCVTEEGAKKHAAKQAESAGLVWDAVAYLSQGKNPKTEKVGMFGSRGECMRQAAQYIKDKAYKDGAYSCSAQ